MNALRGGTVRPFLTAEIARSAAARRAAGLPVVSMHFGQPNEGATAAARRAAVAALDAPEQGYWESAALRSSIAARYAERYAVRVDPTQVLLTAGASAGLVALFSTVFRPGDRVAFACPGYPAYRNALCSLGLLPVEVGTSPTDDYLLTARAVAELDPAPQGLLLASPANPTGTVTPRPELQRIAATCRERGIQLLADEIYHGLNYGERPASALEVEPDAFVVGSFSKFYRMPGWRLGWLVVPSSHAQTIHDALINLFLTPPVLAQHAALASMGDTAELERSVERYRRNAQRLVEGLAGLGIGARMPDGAFYVYADFGRYTRDSLQLCRRAVADLGLGMAPGADFDPQGGHTYVRLCFAVSEADVDRAVALLGGWLPSYRDGIG